MFLREILHSMRWLWKGNAEKNMVTFLVKRRYSNPKTIMHLCEECYTRLCDDYGVEDK